MKSTLGIFVVMLVEYITIIIGISVLRENLLCDGSGDNGVCDLACDTESHVGCCYANPESFDQYTCVCCPASIAKDACAAMQERDSGCYSPEDEPDTDDMECNPDDVVEVKECEDYCEQFNEQGCCVTMNGPNLRHAGNCICCPNEEIGRGNRSCSNQDVRDGCNSHPSKRIINFQRTKQSL